MGRRFAEFNDRVWFADASGESFLNTPSLPAAVICPRFNVDPVSIPPGQKLACIFEIEQDITRPPRSS
jgi:hypothetical protein